MNVTLVDQAVMPPGACFLTGTNVGPFLDTGYQVDDLVDQGRIYLAESTVSELAQQLGYAPPNAWRREQEELAVLRAALAERDELIGKLRGTLDSLLNAGFTTSEPPPAASPEGVLEWVVQAGPEQTPARARAAFEQEAGEPRPRQALLVALGKLIPHEEETDARTSDAVPV